MDAGVAFTSEFPLPPSYYTEFHNSHDIKPPVISDEFNESQIYGGSVIDKVLRYDDSKKYKDLLISEVRIMREEALKNIDTDVLNKDTLFASLTSRLVTIHSLLEEFREHQARSLLINELEKQVDEAVSIKNELLKVYEEAARIIHS